MRDYKSIYTNGLMGPILRSLTLLSSLLQMQLSYGVVVSQRKYVLNILEGNNMLDYKSVDSSMDPNVELLPGQEDSFTAPRRYQRLACKLNYLTIFLGQ
jgi:hypothetical protein